MSHQAPASEHKDYSSPQRKLVKFFETSRDKWKVRCLKGQTIIRQLKNRAHWLEQSRDTWKTRARQLAHRVRELEMEMGSLAPKKKRRTP